jgi:serine phosphatase RsbU (regulator of sigma subunit)
MLVFVPANAQSTKVDSITTELKQSTVDSIKSRLLLQLSDEVRKRNPDSAMLCAKQSFRLATKSENSLAIIKSGKSIFRTYLSLDNYDSCLYYSQQLLDIGIATGDSSILFEGHMTMGALMYRKQKHDISIDHFLESQKIAEHMRDTVALGRSLGNLANAYASLGDYQTALYYDSLSLSYLLPTDQSFAIATGYGNMASNYRMNNDSDLAVTTYLKAIEYYQKTGSAGRIAEMKNGIAKIIFFRGEVDSSILWTTQFYDLGVQQQNNKVMLISVLQLSSFYLHLGQNETALLKAREAITLSEELELNSDIASAHLLAAKANYQLGNFKASSDEFILYNQYNDSLNNFDLLTEITRSLLKSKHEQEKQLLEAEQLRINLEAEAEKKQHQIILFWAGACLLILILLIAYIYRNYKTKVRANLLLAQKNRIIEEKNKDITDSINYAKRIQDATFPSFEKKNQIFPQSFVLYKPKDIVSGDFYWFSEIKGQKIIVAADCTGHGVPGALMSVLGNTFLNEIVNQLEVSQILSMLHDRITVALNQKSGASATNDGMEVALCALETKTNILHFAGANRPLWIIRSSGEAIEEIKGSKQAIGGSSQESVHFSSHSISMEAGDTFYIFSDGFADSFNGATGKKLTTKKFKELLLSNRQVPVEEQGATLEQFLEKWSSGAEQVDDILVIGIRM